MEDTIKFITGRANRSRDILLPLPLLWFEQKKMSPIGSCIWTLGPLLVELLGKVKEPLGRRVLLEEVHHWGWLWDYIAWLHLILFLWSLCVYQAVSRSCCHVFLTMTDEIPLKLWAKIGPFSSKLLFRYSVVAAEKLLTQPVLSLGKGMGFEPEKRRESLLGPHKEEFSCQPKTHCLIVTLKV